MILDDIRLLRELFREDTTESPDRWSPARASAGHCHVASLVIWQRYGGRIMRALVHDGSSKVGIVHYWNRLPGRVDIDCTWDQFTSRATRGPVWDATEEALNIVTREKWALLRQRFQESLVSVSELS